MRSLKEALAAARAHIGPLASSASGLGNCPGTFAFTAYVPIQYYHHRLPRPVQAGIISQPDPAFLGGTLAYQALLFDEYKRSLPVPYVGTLRTEPDAAERLLNEVGRLEDGWDGPGSVAPNPALRRTLAEVVALLHPYIEAAQPDVDPSGGEVSLKWFADDRRAVFSISVLGDCTTVATYTSLDKAGRNWTFAPNRLSALPHVLGHVDFLNAAV